MHTIENQAHKQNQELSILYTLLESSSASKLKVIRQNETIIIK